MNKLKPPTVLDALKSFARALGELDQATGAKHLREDILKLNRLASYMKGKLTTTRKEEE